MINCVAVSARSRPGAPSAKTSAPTRARRRSTILALPRLKRTNTARWRSIVSASEDDLLAQLRPGVDGITLECGADRATLLPQVWDHVSDPRDFLTALKHKAGLDPGFWSPEVKVSRYTVDKYVEDDQVAGSPS